MPTEKQIAASRANSQKSTGPRTAAGKSASRFNAMKHGIHAQHQVIFTESAEDLAELAAEYRENHQPANPTERFLVDTLVNNEWRLRRMRRVEADLWSTALQESLAENPDGAASPTAGDAFAAASTAFERLQRIVNSCQRNFHRASRELKAAQAARAKAQAAPQVAVQAEESTTTSESPASFRNSPENAPAAASATVPTPEIPAANPLQGRPAAA